MPGGLPGQFAPPVPFPGGQPLYVAPPAPPRPVAPPRPAALPPARPSAPLPPVVRGNLDDAPKPAAAPPLRLPSPKELGIAAVTAPAGPTDWTEVRRRLDELGAVGFQVEKTAAGLVRFVLVMPTAVPDRPHRIEVEAAEEGEAVRLGLTRAGDWRKAH